MAPRPDRSARAARPPIAAMSERLTITPHQPANHGSSATKAGMKPSPASRSKPPAAFGSAAASSPGRPRLGVKAERAGRPAPMPSLPVIEGWARRLVGQRLRSMVMRLQSRHQPIAAGGAARLASARNPPPDRRWADRRRESACISCAGHAVEDVTSSTRPVQRLEQRHVLHLDMGKEGLAAARRSRWRPQAGSARGQAGRHGETRRRRQAASPTTGPAPAHGCGPCRPPRRPRGHRSRAPQAACDPRRSRRGHGRAKIFCSSTKTRWRSCAAPSAPKGLPQPDRNSPGMRTARGSGSIDAGAHCRHLAASRRSTAPSRRRSARSRP